MAMTVGELISLLEDFDEETEVRIAHQPSWPFEYELDDVQGIDMSVEYDEDEGKGESAVVDPGDPDRDPDSTIIYLVEGRQIGYLPGIVKDGIGW